MTAEEKKAAEANGTEILRDVTSETNSDNNSEELPQYRKRNRRVECVYISIAVVLGAALIGVLVYFSVTNALKSSDLEPVDNGKNDRQGGGVIETTTYFATTTGIPTGDTNGLTKDNRVNDAPFIGAGRSGNPLLRNLPPRGPPIIEATTTGLPETTTQAVPNFSDKSSLLRGAVNPLLRRAPRPTPPSAAEEE